MNFLTLVSPDLVGKTEWNTSTDNLGSDHNLISVTIHSSFTPQKITLQNTPSGMNSQEKITFFNSVINDAASAAMPTNNAFTCSTPQPIWWDNDCSGIYQECKQALATYKKASNWTNYLNYRRISALMKKTCKQKSRDCWTEFIGSIDKNTPQ